MNIMYLATYSAHTQTLSYQPFIKMNKPHAERVLLFALEINTITVCNT